MKRPATSLLTLRSISPCSTPQSSGNSESMVLLPMPPTSQPGSRWTGLLRCRRTHQITGAITLKSNVNLHIAQGATIRFSRDSKKYPLVFTRREGTELMNYSSIISFMLSSRRTSPSRARAPSTAIAIANIGGRGRVAPTASGSRET
jgi:polygalacturonase